jgi:hypothetical protein
LPIPIRVVIDLADRLKAFQDLAGSENSGLNRKTEGPGVERVGMAHVRPNVSSSRRCTRRAEEPSISSRESSYAKVDTRLLAALSFEHDG